MEPLQRRLPGAKQLKSRSTVVIFTSTPCQRYNCNREQWYAERLALLAELEQKAATTKTLATARRETARSMIVKVLPKSSATPSNVRKTATGAQALAPRPRVMTSNVQRASAKAHVTSSNGRTTPAAAPARVTPLKRRTAAPSQVLPPKVSPSNAGTRPARTQVPSVTPGTPVRRQDAAPPKVSPAKSRVVPLSGRRTQAQVTPVNSPRRPAQVTPVKSSKAAAPRQVPRCGATAKPCAKA